MVVDVVWFGSVVGIEVVRRGRVVMVMVKKIMIVLKWRESIVESQGEMIF